MSFSPYLEMKIEMLKFSVEKPARVGRVWAVAINLLNLPGVREPGIIHGVYSSYSGAEENSRRCTGGLRVGFR
jgi:hypothetical protein